MMPGPADRDDFVAATLVRIRSALDLEANSDQNLGLQAWKLIHERSANGHGRTRLSA